MNNIYSLTIGDWSRDGHEKSDVYMFNVNKTKQEILEAYTKVCNKCEVSLGDGFDQKYKNNGVTICADYEENSIDENIIQKLESIGVNLDFLDGDSEEKSIYPDTICKLFFEMVKTEISDLEYSIFDVESLNLYTIGGIGYGLYY